MKFKINKDYLKIGDKVYKFDTSEKKIKEYMVNSVEIYNYVTKRNNGNVISDSDVVVGASYQLADNLWQNTYTGVQHFNIGSEFFRTKRECKEDILDRLEEEE